MNQYRHHPGCRLDGQEDSISLNQSAHPPSPPHPRPQPHFPIQRRGQRAPRDFYFPLNPSIRGKCSSFFWNFLHSIYIVAAEFRALSKYCPSCHSPILLLSLSAATTLPLFVCFHLSHCKFHGFVASSIVRHKV